MQLIWMIQKDISNKFHYKTIRFGLSIDGRLYHFSPSSIFFRAMQSMKLEFRLWNFVARNFRPFVFSFYGWFWFIKLMAMISVSQLKSSKLFSASTSDQSKQCSEQLINKHSRVSKVFCYIWSEWIGLDFN